MSDWVFSSSALVLILFLCIAPLFCVFLRDWITIQRKSARAAVRQEGIVSWPQPAGAGSARAVEIRPARAAQQPS